MIKQIYLQRHEPLNTKDLKIESQLFKSMYELFTQIGIFWKNTPKHLNLKTELFTFMMNRISLDANYLNEYQSAQEVLKLFKHEYATIEEAYAAFFTDENGLQNPPKTPLAYARQKVSNEFISFQLSIGGFESFGAKNYPGYIHGGYIEGKGTPYRTKIDKA